MAVKLKLSFKSNNYKCMITGIVYDNCSYKIGMLLVDFCPSEFRNLSGLQSFKPHRHYNLALHSGFSILYQSIIEAGLRQ